MFVRNSEYIAQPFCSAGRCLVAALGAGHACAASKEPLPLPKQELKQKNSSADSRSGRVSSPGRQIAGDCKQPRVGEESQTKRCTQGQPPGSA